MAEILVVPSIPDIIPGIAGDVLSDRGHNLRMFNYQTDHDVTAQQFDGLLVLGAPYGVYDQGEHKEQAARTRQLVGEAVNDEDQVPVWGFCHGAQVLADAVGIPISTSRPVSEHGMRAPAPDGRLYTMRPTAAGLRSRFFRDVEDKDIPTFHSHNLMVDIEADTEGRIVVAGIGNIVVPQAVMVKGSDLFMGFQFHNEVPVDDDNKKLHDWQKNAKDLRPLDHKQMEADFNATAEERAGFMITVAGNYSDIVEARAVARGRA